MIDRRYHRSLQLFTWGACAAMTTKLVFFTDYSTRRGREQPHVFTDVRRANLVALVVSLPTCSLDDGYGVKLYLLGLLTKSIVRSADRIYFVYCVVYLYVHLLQTPTSERIGNRDEQLQKFADRKLDEFFGVDLIAETPKDAKPPATAVAPPSAAREE